MQKKDLRSDLITQLAGTRILLDTSNVFDWLHSFFTESNDFNFRYLSGFLTQDSVWDALEAEKKERDEICRKEIS